MFICYNIINSIIVHTAAFNNIELIIVEDKPFGFVLCDGFIALFNSKIYNLMFKKLKLMFKWVL